MAKQLILIRHGKTGYSGRYIGSKNVPLSDKGREQIHFLKENNSILKAATIVASPMLRCRESCEILFSDQHIEFDENLQEIDFGRWEGLNFNEIVLKDSAYVDDWANWSPEFSFPEGESIGHFIGRVQQVADRIISLAEDKVIVVTHGGVIRALLCYFLKLDPSHYLLFNVKKGRFATLDIFPEGAVLTGLNLGKTE